MKTKNFLLVLEQLKKNEPVAFPTETVYGIGANAFDEKAVQKIYTLKGRPSSNPLIVHIAELNQLKELTTKLEPMEEQLMAAFWPGPLTLVFPRSKKVPDTTTGGLETVAVRMPAHPIALELIRSAGTPIAAPSANPSGKPSATHHDHVKNYFGDRLLVLEGGETQHGLESTVLQVKNGIPHIYRLGSITPEDIERVTGVKPILETRSKHSPGTHFKHYAPEAKLILVEPEDWEKTLKEAAQNHKIGALVTEENQEVAQMLKIPSYFLGAETDLLALASHIYGGLIALDQLKLDKIFVQTVPEEGLGMAIMDRLRRAAE